MIPGSGRSAGEEIGYPLQNLGSPSGSAGKESAFNAGDLGSIPGLERSAGEGKGYPLQYSGLEISMDCIDHEVAKSRTPLSNSHSLILEQVAISFSRGSFLPRDQTHIFYVSCIGRRILYY